MTDKLLVTLSIAMRGTAAFVAFLSQILLANILPQSSMGNYFLFISWSRYIDVVIGGGARQNSLRLAAKILEQKSSMLSLRYIYSKYKRMFNIVILVAVLFFCAFLIFKNDYLYIANLALMYGSIFAVVRTISEILKGVGRPNIALFGEYVLEQLVVISVVSIIYLFDLNFSFEAAGILYFAAILITLLFVIQVYRNTNNGLLRIHATDEPNSISRRFWFINVATSALWVMPYLILPIYVDESDVALFGVAQKVVAIATIVLVGLSATFSRKFSVLFTNNQFVPLRKKLYESQVFSLVMYTPFLLIFILLGDRILSVFGPEYINALDMLIVIAVGQFINVATGLSTEMMHMMHKESMDLTLILIVLIVGILLSVILLPELGVLGMAISFSAMLAVKNISTYILCHIIINRHQTSA